MTTAKGRMSHAKIKRLLLWLLLLVGLTATFNAFNGRPASLFGLKPERQGYEARPASFLEHRRAAANESHCTFNYGLPDGFSYEEEELGYPPGLGPRSGYRILYNVVEAARNVSKAKVMPSVTYATHVTAEFAGYIAEIARFWDGPVSVAAFVPDYDAELLTNQLATLCRCLERMSKVSVHFVFPAEHRPRFSEPPAPTEANSCALALVPESRSFRHSKNLTYPVNVCRNAARTATTTPFVLVSDVQLIPSQDLASKFLAFLARSLAGRSFPSRKVFVVPVFEVGAGEPIPRTKDALREMVRTERAIYFHRYVCSHCQKFPGLEKWLDTDTRGAIKPFLMVKREYPFHRWEPIYIGTKYEPLYGEQLSWEGRQDKMTQMLEMCLLGYKFLILDGAFLVHWPGIKRKPPRSAKNRETASPHQLENGRQYKNIVAGFAKKYSKNPKCKLQ